MVILTPQQNDALVELVNIAFERTAGSLSELTGQRVQIGLPEVSVCPIEDVYNVLRHHVDGEVVTIHQVFAGPVAGDALLLLDQAGAKSLTSLLTQEQPVTAQLDASAQEVLIEVGNILLNACLGMFGNLLKVHASFSVPRLHLDSLHVMMNSIIVESSELRYALIVATRFQVQQSLIQGYLAIILGVESLDRLIHAALEWAESPLDDLRSTCEEQQDELPSSRAR